MNQDFEALASLYALDALDGEDLAAFQKELEASEPLRDLVREYRDAAAAFPLSLDPVEPSPALRTRLLGSVSAPIRRSAPVFTRVFWSLAAVALISLLIHSIGTPRRAIPITGHASGVMNICGDDMVEVDIAGLPALPDGKCFQLWHLGPSKTGPVDQGTFVCDGQGNYRGWDKMKFKISDKDAFAVTMEPDGGSKSPTLPILAIAKR